MVRVAAIVPAAGTGTRLGGPTPKALRQLAGEPLVRRSVLALQGHPGVVQVVVAAAADQVGQMGELLGPGVQIVIGGSDRQSSVAAALAVVRTDCDVVLVHDAARPLIPRSLVDRVLTALAAGADAVVPGLPVADTIKVVNDQGVVVSTPPRDALRAIQTPQGFRREVLVAAHAAARRGATDDAALVEQTGCAVRVVAGDPAAMKLTTAADLDRAEALVREAAGR